jgi:DNA-binding NarL/FixJ family response regulator
MQATDSLTKQERVVLRLVARGWRNNKIAQELVISPRTVESHLHRIFNKLGVTTRTEAALYTMANSISEFPGTTHDAGNPIRYSEEIG